VIEKGSTVKMHYKLFVDGNEVDASHNRGPLSYVHGAGQIIPGLEAQIVGMKTGDKKTVTLPPEKGYGKRNSLAVQKVPRNVIKDSDALKKGDIVRATKDEKVYQLTVIETGENEITLDMNHPLAGKTLNFDVEIVEIKPSK